MLPTPLAGEADHGGPDSRDKNGRLHLSAIAALFPTPDTRGFTNNGSLQMLADICEDEDEFIQMAYRAGKKKKKALWLIQPANSGNGAGTHGEGGADLQTAVLWPTPLARDADKNSKNRPKYLPGAVWATPTANDAKNSQTGSQRGRGTLTAHIVETMWPTPRTAGMCGGSGNWARLQAACETPEEARKMGAGNGGQLNADWVERLMGYPDGWTDIEKDGVDTRNKYPAAWLDGSWDTIPRLAVKQKNRRERIKALGNAVVPQIPSFIWRLVKDWEDSQRKYHIPE